MVATASELVEFSDGQSVFSQVAHFQFRFFLFQKCLCLTACRAIGLVQELDLRFCHISTSLLRNQNPPARKKRVRELAKCPRDPRPEASNKSRGRRHPRPSA